MGYEIQQRQSGQKHAGFFTVVIDGVDAEFLCDPSQFMPKAMRKALEVGAEAGEQATTVAMSLCEAYARTSLGRVITSIQAGQKNPGGGILTRKFDVMKSLASDILQELTVNKATGMTAAEMASRPRGNEDETKRMFLERGHLAGLSDKARRTRLLHREQLTDVELEQRRRRAMLKKLEGWLKAAESELKKAVPEQVPALEKRIAELMTEIKAIEISVVAATHGYQYGYGQYMQGAIDLVNNDIRIWPLMTNTTADTERDGITTFSNFTTTDEFNGANYSSGGLALDTQAVNIDDANDRAEFDSADETVSALGAGTRSIQGLVVGKFSVNTAGSLPLHWIEFASSKTPDGSDFTFVFNAEGIIQAADG